jgi:hypothetical protein
MHESILNKRYTIKSISVWQLLALAGIGKQLLPLFNGLLRVGITD